MVHKIDNLFVCQGCQRQFKRQGLITHIFQHGRKSNSKCYLLYLQKYKDSDLFPFTQKSKIQKVYLDDDKNEIVIYKITNLINNKIYVGQTIYYNNPYYWGSGFWISRAIKKYGILNFKKECLEICIGQKSADEREKFWINELNCRNPDIGYNISEGGTGGSIGNSEKLKKSVQRSWDIHPERKKEWSKRFSGSGNGMFGKKLSYETRKKYSEDRKKLVGELNSMFNKQNPNKGKTLKEINGDEWWIKEQQRRKIQSRTRHKVILKSGDILIYKSVKEMVLTHKLSYNMIRRLKNNQEPDHETIKGIETYVEN